MKIKITKLFLRIAIASAFLSAVADRWGWWGYHLAWGDWQHFLDYTQSILPWFSSSWISVFAILATVLEIVFAIGLLIGWKTHLFALLSGVLLLSFALMMTFSGGVKSAFDASVFTASAAAFALSTIRERFLELDILFFTKKDIDYNVINKYINHGK